MVQFFLAHPVSPPVTPYGRPKKRVTFFYHVYKRFFYFGDKKRVFNVFLIFSLTFITSMILCTACAIYIHIVLFIFVWSAFSAASEFSKLKFLYFLRAVKKAKQRAWNENAATDDLITSFVVIVLPLINTTPWHNKTATVRLR